MGLFDEINGVKYCYLADLRESGDNSLRIILEEARADGPVVEYGDDGRKLAFPAKAIETTPGCARFDIQFDSYIAFAVRDESFGQVGKTEVYEGEFAMIYSQSHFLDFVSNGTWASEDHPGPYVHYGFWTLNHLVDIASCAPPKVLRSAVTEARGQYRHANWQPVQKNSSE